MLFDTYQLGKHRLQNRIVMPPMTRSRAGKGDTPTALMAEYYAQRASAGLIITEGTPISRQGKGYAWTPGIYTREREEEIIRARWVPAGFKRTWVRFFYMLSAAVYDKADMVTSLFDNARKTQIDIGCRPEQCRVIANGIHFERFRDIPLKKEDGWIDIGAIVRLAPIKDIKTLIYAFYELKFRMKNVRLHIIGPEDDVLFTGMTDVLKYMEKLDFTVLSSISEGQPLSVLESFAAGRPCVTTDVGCCRELLNGMEGDDLGCAGLCVPPMERTALCNALERMSTHTEERYLMGKVGKKRVERFFRHEDMIANYENAYTEVMRKWRESVSH